MKVYVEQIATWCCSHGGAGRPSLAESMLYFRRDAHGQGRGGRTVADFEPEEVRRHISLSTSLIPGSTGSSSTSGCASCRKHRRCARRCAWPTRRSLGRRGVLRRGRHQLTSGLAEDNALPRVLVISKLDRDNASFQRP
jgi:elongation factor G